MRLELQGLLILTWPWEGHPALRVVCGVLVPWRAQVTRHDPLSPFLFSRLQSYKESLPAGVSSASEGESRASEGLMKSE